MSETINLKLLKHDNVETNTEMFDIEKYLNENWDKIDEDVGTINTEISNIQAINKEHSQIIDTKVDKVSGKGLSTNDFTNEYKTKLDKLQNYNDSEVRNEVAEINKKDTEQDGKMEELQNEKLKLEKELKEVQEDFYQASVRGQASGEYIHVEDSSNCRAKIGISGNSEQETRKGYNQFKIQSSATSNNGVTITKNSDSSVTYSGTTTGAFTHTLVQYNNLEVTKKLYLKNCGTLTNANFIVQLIRSGKTSVEYITIQSDIILNVGDIIQKIYVQQQLTGKALSGTCNILLTDYENKDKGYEQYGAMPSPDYCSEIKTVGSNVNIFDENDVTLLDGVYIDASTGMVGSGNDCRSLYMQCKPNTTYTVSKIQSARFCIAYSSNDKIAVGDIITVMKAENSSTVLTVKTGSNAKLLMIMYSKLSEDKVTKQQILDSIKIVEGTETGEYSKKGQGSVKVIACNKNIWNLGNKGNNSGDISFPLKSGKYTLSFKKKRISNSAITNAWVYRYAYIRFYDKNDTLLSSIKDGMAINLTANQTSDRQIIDFTAPENTVKMVVNFSNNNGDNNNNTETIEIQLEEEKATAFEQHEEQSYIMPVQKEMLEGDYFNWDNEEEVHVWKKYEVTGNEGWITSSSDFSSEKIYSAYLTISDMKEKSKIYCTHFKNIIDATKQYIFVPYSNILVTGISKDIASDVTDFKNYLKSQYDAGTPVVVYYKLETPNRLKFTDEQKVVAKELKNVRTYKNVTNITTDSKAIISLDYAKDTETEHNKMQKEIAEIKQLLSTTQTSAMLLDNLQKEIEREVE